MDLPDKVTRKHNKAMLKKLDALRELGEHLGMYGKVRIEPDEMSLEYVILAIIQLYNDNANAIQKTACGYILDYYIPEWRENAPKEIIGPILKRGDNAVLKWKKEVLRRDDYQCVNCGSEENLEVHHIVNWSEAPELRICVDNGETLCTKCHSIEHKNIKNFILAKRK